MEKIGAYTERTTEGGEWRPGTPTTGQQATPMLASYFNMMQRELVTVVESAGIELDKDDDGQLLQAIRRLRGGAATNFGQWAWSNSLAGNPGAGRVALNHATPGSATRLFITEANGEGVDFTQSLGLLRAGDTITLQERDSAVLSHRLRVTGPAVDEGVYRAIPIEYVSGSGGRPAADAIVSVLLTQAGAADSSLPVGSVMWWPRRTSIPKGFGPADGQILDRSLYPDLTKMVIGNQLPLATDANWLATPIHRGKYSLGDGVSTIRLPDYNGKAAGAQGAVFLRGDGAQASATAGDIQLDAMQGHRHAWDGNAAITSSESYSTGGASSARARYDAVIGDPITDGRNGVPRIASETRPINVTGCWVIKLFGSVVNEGSADAAQLATVYAALVGRVDALEERPRGIGDGQNWQNLVASRAAGTTYTNTTGRSITVSIFGANQNVARGLLVSGELVGSFTPITSGSISSTVSAVVPAGAIYSVTSGLIISSWMELR